MKIHFYDVEDPLEFITNGTTRANCGKIVLGAQPRFLLFTMEAAEGLSAISNCAACWEFPWSKKYRYGIVSGQESLRSPEWKDRKETA